MKSYPPDAWIRFHIYAAHVKDLTLILGNDKLIREIANSGNTLPKLLPNLVYLRLDIQPEFKFRQHFASLFSPNLHGIDVRFRSPHPALETVLKVVRNTVRGLLDFHLKFGPRAVLPPETYDKIARTLRHQPSLVRVCLDVPARVNLAGLFIPVTETLPDLRSLSISWIPTEHPPPRLPASYPSLTSLFATTQSEGVESFLSRITSTSLSDIQLTLTGPGVPVLTDLQRFVDLRTIDIKLLAGGVISFDELIPLLSCRHITQLKVSSKGRVQLLDLNVKSMAQAWPDLETLEIADQANDILPLASLRGLEAFGEYCPHLQSLKISVDAHNVGSELTTHPGLEVEELNLLHSKVGAEWLDAASFIRSMWPNLQKGQTWNGTLGPHAALWSSIWSEVKPKGGLAR